jgi:Holliday junction resolvasome RuvABC DNA-binding subunit
VVELADRFDHLAQGLPAPAPRPGEDAVQALVGLGYAVPQAEEAVRGAMASGVSGTAPLIREALQRLAARK